MGPANSPFFGCCTLGVVDGYIVGTRDGLLLRCDDGLDDGRPLGCSLLFSFNCAVDCIDERVVGCTDGKVLGWIDDHVKGCLIGRVDGCIVGTCCKGCAEGVTLGWLDGRRLGSTLGEVDTT